MMVLRLKHVTVGEAQVKVVANLQYEIENTGIKGLVVRLPASAENVRFRGEQVTDFIARPVTAGDASRDWDVKLGRRWMGRYALQVAYSLPLLPGATEAFINGVQARDANLQ